MGTFGTLRCLWILPFIGTDTNFANWPSRLFTEPWPGCPPECLSRYLGSPDLGAPGPPPGPPATLGPGPGHAPGRWRPSTSQCRGQHSVLFIWSFLGSTLVVIVHCFGSTLVHYIDLEIWTLLVEFIVSISLLTSDFLRFGFAIIDFYNLSSRFSFLGRMSRSIQQNQLGRPCS